MIEIVEAGTHVPRIRRTGSMYTAACPDCTWRRHYESLFDAELFSDAHRRRVGQVPGQLALR